MDIILLGGNSKTNKEWIHEVGKAFAPLFEKATVLDYEHWDTGGALIDLDAELVRLQGLIRGDSGQIIFAKSAGTLLALRGIKEGKLRPKGCIFTGLAAGWGRVNGFDVDSWLENYSTPTLFIEKTFDPACSFQELKSLIEAARVKNFLLKEMPGDDHDYGDIEFLKAESESFIASLASVR